MLTSMLPFIVPAFVAFILMLVAKECSESAKRPPGRKPDRFVSDHEFVEASGTRNAKLALRVRQIVAEQLDLDPNLIHPDDRFAEDLHAD